MFALIAEAIAHPTRREPLALLDEHHVIGIGDLARALEISPAATSNLVDIIERAGLAARVRCGRTVLVESLGSVEILVHRRPFGRIHEPEHENRTP